MTKSVQVSSTRKSRRPTYKVQVQRIAKMAAEVSSQHVSQFANLAALARTILSYIPPGKKQQRDYALLASAMVDSAENYKGMAQAYDVAFSIVATQNPLLLSQEGRAEVLRCAESAGKPSGSKRAKVGAPASAARH